jgi:hypothetical protein
MATLPNQMARIFYESRLGLEKICSPYSLPIENRLITALISLTGQQMITSKSAKEKISSPFGDLFPKCIEVACHPDFM